MNLPSQSPINDPVTLYVANLSEDVWPFINSISSAEGRNFEISDNASLADRDLFSLLDRKRLIFVSPFEIDREFLSWCKQFGGQRDVATISPDRHSGKVCEDLLQQPQLLNKISDLCNGGRISLVGYAASPWLYDLASALRSLGHEVFMPEAPQAEKRSSIDFAGSKEGFRQICRGDCLAPGEVADSIEEAADLAAARYLNEGAVVLKTNRGHAGSGVLIFSPGTLQSSQAECRQNILKQLAGDDFWSKFPIVVESYIDAPRDAGAFPSAEFFIGDDGSPEFLYACGMYVSEAGVFQGVEIGRERISRELEIGMREIGEELGRKYFDLGVKGYYDVDFIVSKSGKLYASESNVRRTGGTHAYILAKTLLGEGFAESHCIIANNGEEIGRRGNGCNLNFKSLLQALQPVLLDPGYARPSRKGLEGVVPISAERLKLNKLGYVIFAPDSASAGRIRDRMWKLIDDFTADK